MGGAVRHLPRSARRRILGVADRWADIAVAAMSTEWDYGPGWERPLVEAYGVDFDEERMSFYQRLWDST